LDRSELGVVTNMRNFDSAAIDQVDQVLSRINCLWFAINRNCHLLPALRGWIWMALKSRDPHDECSGLPTWLRIRFRVCQLQFQGHSKRELSAAYKGFGKGL